MITKKEFEIIKSKQKNYKVISKCIVAMVLFSPLICLANNKFAHDVSYKLYKENENCIKVEATFQGKSSNEYFFRFPPGVTKYDLSSPKPISQEFTPIQNVLKVRYEPHQPIRLIYHYCNHNPIRHPDYPIIESDLIYFQPANAFVFPEYARDQKSKIHIDLTSLPKEYSIATSFNINNRDYIIHESLTNLANSIIEAGKIKIDTVYIKEKPVHIVTNGSWPYFKKSPSNYIKKIIEVHRKFWNDYDFPIYTLFLIKQNENSPQRILLGRHWYQSLSALLPEDKNALNPVTIMLSHEISHAWVPLKMSKTVENDLAWFYEGFNDYYAFYNIYQNGLISKKDYIDNINKIVIRNYYFSPIANSSKEEMQSYAFTRNDYRMFNQMKVHLLARMLRENADQKANYDNAMNKLFEEYQKNNDKILSAKDIDNAFIENIGKEKWEQTKKTIDSLEMLDFPEYILEPRAKMKMMKFDVPVCDFDAKHLINHSVLKDVAKDSPAYKAGLRSGQKVLDFNINFADPKKKFVFVIEVDGQSKKIEYMPKTSKKWAPQYQLA